MNRRRVLVHLGQLSLLGSLVGCAAPRRPCAATEADKSVWHGRLAVRLSAEHTLDPSRSQAFSAAFDLSGDARQGDLVFYTPLGSTAATIRWAPHGASMLAQGENRQYPNLDQLIVDLLGTDVPVTALFHWLNGQPYAASGWQADLSAHDQGKITAHRLTSPSAELRVILEP